MVELFAPTRGSTDLEAGCPGRVGAALYAPCMNKDRRDGTPARRLDGTVANPGPSRARRGSVADHAESTRERRSRVDARAPGRGRSRATESTHALAPPCRRQCGGRPRGGRVTARARILPLIARGRVGGLT